MKFFNKIKKMPRKLIAVIAVLIVLAGIPTIFSLVKAEFYPNRQPFDYNKPCNPTDGDIYDRCGSLTGPVFNSFINTPSYGDERSFVDARRSDQTAAGSFKNVLQDVTGGSREVVVRMYVHNNANQDTNASGLGIARDAKVRMFIPTGEGQVMRARGYVSASNAALVEDTVDFVGNQNYRVEYIPGSAMEYNNGAFKNGVQLSDSIVTTGAPIGDTALDGNLPGCFQHELVVQVRIRVIVKETPQMNFTKEVRKAGEKDWHKEVKAKPGDKVEWILTTQVTKGTQNNIVVRDQGVPNNKLDSGSVKWIDAAQGTVPQGDKPLFDGGVNFGNYAAGGGFYVMFTTTVQGDFEGCEARVRNLAYAKSDQTKEIGDDADVIITKENCVPPVNPVYSCDSLQSTYLGGNKYGFKLNYTAKDGAKFKQATYTANDGSEPLVTTKTDIEHTFAKPGSYIMRADVTFTVNGKDQTVSSDNCAAVVNIPEYRCDNLTAQALGNKNFKFNLKYTAAHGATFKDATYDFGDNTSPVTTSQTSVQHGYKNDGNYTTRVTIRFMVNGKEVTATSNNCVTKVAASTPPKYCPIPGKTNLPENSPQCAEEKKCTIPGKENLPANSPECVIVNTGVGDLFGIFSATTVAGAAAHSVFSSRRSARGL